MAETISLDESPEILWFENIPKCRCGKPSAGILRGARNESFGHHCKRCADKRLAASKRARQIEAALRTMLKAAATGKNGRKIMLLGLEEMNVTQMRKGDPMHIHADELGFPGEIVIILGKDADALREMLEPLIGPETHVNDERERKRQ